jgi:hypothetical protein
LPSANCGVITQQEQPHMPASNIVDVKERLERIHHELNELIELATNDPSNRVAIRNKYGCLKVKLKADSKKYGLLKARKTETEYFLRLYNPAVSEAANCLSVAIGGKVNELFIETINEARGRIMYYLNQCKKV